MQSEIRWYKFRIVFPGHFCNYFEQNIAYFSKGVWGRAVSSPSKGRGSVTEAKAFLGFTLASNSQIFQKRLNILFS